MPVEIRSATEQDEAAIVALWRICDLIVHPNDPVQDFRFICAKPTSDILAAFDGDELIGSIATGHDSSRGWLSYVAVDPARRGDGVGRALVQAAERWLASRDVAKVHLTVRATNAAVVRFYERIGYGVMPSVLMEKALRKPD